jgi:hypothetical protein
MSVIEGGGIRYTIVRGDTLSRIFEKHPGLGYSSWIEMRDANLEELERVGRDEMEKLGIDKTCSRQPCGIKGHSSNLPHRIPNGIHYDGPGKQTTIYPGTKIFLKQKSPSGSQNDIPYEASASIDKPGHTGERDATNRISKGLFSQHPNPRLEIYEFKDNNLSPCIIFDGVAQEVSRQLLSYEFSEAVDDVKGSFSFSVENGTYDDGSTVFDKIKLRSIVYIYEGDEKAVFIGVIRQKNVGSAMHGAGPRKTITFSGCSLMGLVSDFVLSLDIKIMDISDAGIASKQLTIKLMEALTIPEFLKITFDNYINLTMKNFKMNECETVKILKAVTKNESLSIFTHGTHDSKFAYNIANAFYSQGRNNIVDMWKNILPNPIYEIYGYCDREGSMKIMVRESPFDEKPWTALRMTVIEPISLKSYSLRQSDEEVYTVFNCWLEGSIMGHDFYTVVNQYEGEESAMVIDKLKLAKYGYRPLEMAFRGYDRSQNIKEGASGLAERFRKINERAARWYSRLDDMLTGNITIVTNFVEPHRNPKIGEKVFFLDGEFYVKSVSHTWNYGGNPSINLNVSRGMIYNNGTVPEGDAGVLKQLGAERREVLE